MTVNQFMVVISCGVVFFLVGFFILFMSDIRTRAKKEKQKQAMLPSYIVVKKFRANYPGITYAEFELVWEGLLSFFDIIAKSRRDGVNKSFDMPSVIADSLWHEMILDTKNYMDMCSKYFGGYIHHHPHAVSFETDYSNKEVIPGVLETCRALLKNKKSGSYFTLPVLLTVDEQVGLKSGYRYNRGIIYEQLSKS